MAGPCLALMYDGRGDEEILAAQAKMRETLGDWIPTIRAAQEPDGYLHTAYTLRTEEDKENWPGRWTPEGRAEHEGYVAGYGAAPWELNSCWPSSPSCPSPS